MIQDKVVITCIKRSETAWCDEKNIKIEWTQDFDFRDAAKLDNHDEGAI